MPAPLLRRLYGQGEDPYSTSIKTIIPKGIRTNMEHILCM